MKKILAVDDDTTILESIGAVLEDEGYCMYSATSSHTLKEQLKHITPHLLLMDIRLGRENGARIAEDLKKDQRTSNIPIVLISANYDGRKLSQQVGATAFLGKPFDIDELSRIVRKYANPQ